VDREGSVGEDMTVGWVAGSGDGEGAGGVVVLPVGWGAIGIQTPWLSL
jgi:hypothetical protein